MNTRTPQFKIVGESDYSVVIKDVGPWDKYPTVTNGAEEVVAAMLPRLNGRCFRRRAYRVVDKGR